ILSRVRFSDQPTLSVVVSFVNRMDTAVVINVRLGSTAFVVNHFLLPTGRRNGQIRPPCRVEDQFGGSRVTDCAAACRLPDRMKLVIVALQDVEVTRYVVPFILQLNAGQSWFARAVIILCCPHRERRCAYS